MALSPSEQKRLLAASLADQPGLVGTLEFVWRQARLSFPPERVAEWTAACGEISARLGSHAALSFIRNSPSVAVAAGPSAALALATAAVELGTATCANAAVALIVAAPLVARRLASAPAFGEFLRIVRLIAALAPESITLLLERADAVLSLIDLRAFESWALGGIRAAENDPERRLKFFALLDAKAAQGLAHEASELQYADVERELKAFVVALWRRLPAIRTFAPAAFDAASRAAFGNGVIRLPVSFRGYRAERGRALYRAALAHILAHFQFTPRKFPIGELKPVQLALVSLIEDARVEQLAIRSYPGLRRLWLPFHVAEPSSAVTAPALMARLARALIDPAYADPNGWVASGRNLFLSAASRWEDPQISRLIGGALGNDLGQMRVQFNAKSYTVEPVYRDDNQGLWELAMSGAASEGDTVYEAARFEQASDEEPDRQRQSPESAADQQPANRAALVQAQEEVGIPVARYPEWDFLIARDRNEWTTVLEYQPVEGHHGEIERILAAYPEVVYRLTSLIRAAKVSRPRRLRRQPEGDRLDLEACIDAAIDRRNRATPNPKVYARLERRFRDLSVLLLLDVSQSTNDIVRAAQKSVLDLERDATALLAHAMDGLGDPFAIHAFCSNTRDDVHYYRIKDFHAGYDATAKRRLAGLCAGFSTRMGAALRHAGQELARQMSYRRLLLMISDGEPSDVDIADPRYLVEDARRAVMSLQHMGIDVFCVGLDAGGDNYLTRIFGRRNVVQVDRLERLPQKLPLLYFRLAG